jgi:two-component system, OmpR family, phosphate regulon response regulator PhoB
LDKRSIAVTTKKIYLLEDDNDFANAVVESLEREGFAVNVFNQPHEFFYAVIKEMPHLAIIDWVLPEMSGLDVVRRLRQRQLPELAIIMLTQMNEEEYVVGALQAGADDFVIKPEHSAILVARVHAILRRYFPDSAEAVLTLARPPYRLEFRARQCFLHDKEMELAPREFDLFWTLLQGQGRLFSRSELLASVWGKHQDPGEHTLTQHVYAVRKKLALAEHGFKLAPIYGRGYRLDGPD